jgi:hypothetical protein
MTKKTMFETVFPNANTGNGVTFTEEKLGGEISMKKYKVFMSGWMKTTVYVEAENEDEALDNAQMEMSFDNLEEIEVLGTVNEEDE